jgi:hypothetical protein
MLLKNKLTLNSIGRTGRWTMMKSQQTTLMLRPRGGSIEASEVDGAKVETRSTGGNGGCFAVRQPGYVKQ